MVGGRTWYLVFAKTLLVVFLPLHMLSCFCKRCSDVWGFSWLQGVPVRSAIRILSSSLALDSMKTGEGSENHECSCVMPTLQAGEPSAKSPVFLTMMESEEKPTTHQSKASRDLCSTTVVRLVLCHGTKLNFWIWAFLTSYVFLQSLQGLVVHATGVLLLWI